MGCSFKNILIINYYLISKKNILVYFYFKNCNHYYMSAIEDHAIDFHARRIQRQFRKNKILKCTTHFLNLKLIETGKDTSFLTFADYIRTKDVVDVSKKYIDSFNQYKKDFKLNSKILLTAYLISLFKEELLGKELHQMDQGVLEWSQEVVKRIDEIKQSSDSKEVDKLWLLLNNYNVIFRQWKESDKSRMVESIIISYYNRCKHIEKINADAKLDEEQKKLCIEELEKQKISVLSNIKFIDPEFNVEYFKENYELVYDNMNKAYDNMALQIGNTMKKAYFDMLKEEMKVDNYLPIAEVMVEISKRLLVIVPEKRREKFAEKINAEVIVELISEKSWTSELQEYLKFVCESVFMLGAPCDDEENKKWLNEVNQLMQDNYDNNLPLILIQIEEKLDRIYQLINEFNNNQKK